MANDNNPRGLIPRDYPHHSGHWYRVGTAADIYLGQPVQLDATGYVVGIGTATGVTLSIGVATNFAGVNKGGIATPDPFLDVSDLTPPSPTSDTGDRYVFVADDPEQLFIVQEDTGGTALALADNFSGVDLLYRGASGTAVNGNDNTGWANIEIDASTVVQTTAAFMQLMQLHDTTNTDGTANAVGDYAKWVVRLLHHNARGAAVALPVI